MNYLLSEYEKDRDAEELVLEFMQITDLAPLMPTLEKFKQLKKLSLHGNRLRYLPTEMSQLKSLEEIDLTNNMFSSLDDVLTSLQYIPQLKSLLYNLRNEQEKQQCIRMLPRLVELNRQIVRASHLNSPVAPKKEVPSIQQKDIEDIAVLYDRIRQVYRENGVEVDQQLAEEFDDTVEAVIKDLGRKLKQQNESEYITKTRVLCSKYALTDLCFSKFIGLFGIIEQKWEGVLQTIHNNHANIFKEMTEIILYKQFTVEEKEHTQHIKHRLKIYQAEMERLRKQRDSCVEEIAELSLQNDRLYEHLMRFGRNPPSAPAFTNSNVNNQTPERARKVSKKENEQVISQSLQSKKLNLNQLKQLIQEMFASKAQYDRKCEESCRPIETMEQYMYTYFNKKYGLKSLTVEWAMGIVNAIKKYSPQDVQVAVFGKILRNQFEQQFRDDQLAAKRQLDDCFKTQIKRKTQKLAHQVDLLFAEKQQSSFPLYEVEQVVRYFFSKEDAELLLQQISDRAGMDSSSTLSPTAKQKGKSIRYSTLIHLLQEHLMRQHQFILQQFVKEFKRVDLDSDGIISESQFRNLYSSMAKEEQRSHYNEIVSAVDPGNHRQITFSRACYILQNSPSPDPLISLPKS